MKRNSKKRPDKRLRCCYGLLAFFVVLELAFGSLLAANIACENTAHFTPSYARVDLTELLLKDEREQADYETIYAQTGLSREGIARLEAEFPKKEDFTANVLAFQEAFFADCPLVHETVGPITMRDLAYANGDSVYAPLAPLENGDILISSTCHSFGWRHGHAALVVNAQNGSVLESVTIGVNSSITYGGALWFQESSNFMLLRLKAEYRTTIDPSEVAAQAAASLFDIPYSLTVGIFSKKDQGTQPKATHCSHLVWQAYKNFGIDVDSNGGAIVSSKDIANSPYFEVVQVYGFDPVKLWN